jgi:hypothetical protein
MFNYDNDLLQKTLAEINNEIDSEFNELEKKLAKIQEYLYQTKKNFPIINIFPKFESMLNPNQKDINHIINVILFILSNIRIFNEISLSKKTPENLNLQPHQNEKDFTKLFINLIKQMRDPQCNNVNYEPIHKYLKEELKEAEYYSEDPSKLFKLIFEMIKSDLKSAKNIDRIMEDNFTTNSKIKKMCENGNCEKTRIISERESTVIDLYLSKPEFLNTRNELQPELLKNLLLSEIYKYRTEICENCHYDMRIYGIIEPKTYLFININRESDPNYEMGLLYPLSLKINCEDYVLISALTTKNSKYISKNSKYILFYKNYFNDKWYKIVDGKEDNIPDNSDMENIISDNYPNILIYKKLNEIN